MTPSWTAINEIYCKIFPSHTLINDFDIYSVDFSEPSRETIPTIPSDFQCTIWNRHIWFSYCIRSGAIILEYIYICYARLASLVVPGVNYGLSN